MLPIKVGQRGSRFWPLELVSPHLYKVALVTQIQQRYKIRKRFSYSSGLDKKLIGYACKIAKHKLISDSTQGIVSVRARRHMGTQRVSTSSLPNCPTLVQVISLTSNNQGHMSREGYNPGSYDHKSKLDIVHYNLNVGLQQEAMINWEWKNGLYTPRSQRKVTVTQGHSRQNIIHYSGKVPYIGTQYKNTITIAPAVRKSFCLTLCFGGRFLHL